MFFMPVRLVLETGFIAFALSAYVFPKTRSRIDFFPVRVIKSAWFWVLAAVVLLTGSYFAFVPDQFGYYIPTLTWLKDFGLITGTSNVNWSLSQMSFFHILESGLDETLDYFLRLNVFISLLYLLYAFERKAYVLLLFVPFYFLFIQSLSPDVSVAFISLIIVHELCFHYKKEMLNMALILAAFLFAVKPTACWAILWIGTVYLFENGKKLFRRENLLTCITTVCFLFLVIVKNTVSSSTLIFPSTFPHLDTWWQNSPFVTDYMKDIFQSKTFNLHYTAKELASMSFFQKIIAWLTFDYIRSCINIFVILVCTGFGIFACVKKNRMWIILWIAVSIKLVFTFWFSGQFRFLLDGLWSLLLILFLQTGMKGFKTKILTFTLFVSAGLALSFPKKLFPVFPETYVDWMIEGFTAPSLLRPETDHLKQYCTATLGNLTFHVSTACIFNFDTPQPAFTMSNLQQYARWGIFPQMKDPSNIRKGLYIKTLSDKEKEELENIIKKLES